MHGGLGRMRVSAPEFRFPTNPTGDRPLWMRCYCGRCGWRSHRKLPVLPQTPLEKLILTFNALLVHYPGGWCPRGDGQISARIEEE